LPDLRFKTLWNLLTNLESSNEPISRTRDSTPFSQRSQKKKLELSLLGKVTDTAAPSAVYNSANFSHVSLPSDFIATIDPFKPTWEFELEILKTGISKQVQNCLELLDSCPRLMCDIVCIVKQQMQLLEIILLWSSTAHTMHNHNRLALDLHFPKISNMRINLST